MKVLGLIEHVDFLSELISEYLYNNSRYDTQTKDGNYYECEINADSFAEEILNALQKEIEKNDN